MREVIDYSKDFLSGETIERKRNKGDVNYRGIATVQLFDEKGNMIQEVKSENCINKRWLSYLYRSFFSSRLIFNKSPDLGGYSVAQYMLLTDNTNAENDHGVMIEGNFVGYADGWKTYSGSDKLKGTLNEAESSATDFRKHFVIDFPTHTANGTFQSIYWIPDSSNYGPSFVKFKEVQIIFKSKNDYYFTVIDNYMYAYCYSLRVLHKIDISTGKITKEVEYTDTESVKYVGRNQNNIYIFTASYANVYDLDFNFVKKINLNRLPGTSTASITKYTSYEDGFLAIDGNSYVHLLDTELNEIREISYLKGVMNPYLYIGNGIFVNIVSYRSDRISGIKYYDIYNDKIISLNVDYVYDFYTKDGEERAYAYNNYDGCYDWNTDRIYYYTGNSNSTSDRIYYYAVKIPWFAHTLLPAPVTKTATNTMKIQYDFIVEERGYFD